MHIVKTTSHDFSVRLIYLVTNETTGIWYRLETEMKDMLRLDQPMMIYLIQQWKHTLFAFLRTILCRFRESQVANRRVSVTKGL